MPKKTVDKKAISPEKKLLTSKRYPAILRKTRILTRALVLFLALFALGAAGIFIFSPLFGIILFSVSVIPITVLGVYLGISSKSALEYGYWVMFMDKKYPSGWDEERFAFAPYFDHRESGNKGKVLRDLQNVSLYENGLLGTINFKYVFNETIDKCTFVPWEDLETVILQKLPEGHGWLSFETVDLKTVTTPEEKEELAAALIILRERLGSRWKAVFKEEKPDPVIGRKHHFLAEQEKGLFCDSMRP